MNLGGSVGEVDYNSTGAVFGEGAQNPDVDVLQLGAGSAGIDVTGRLTRRHTLGLGADLVYRTPLNLPDVDDPEVGETEVDAVTGGVPEQLHVQSTVSIDTRVSPMDAVEVSLIPGYFDYNRGETQYASIQGIAQWRRQLRPSLSSGLGAGLFYFAGVGGTSSDSNPVQPVATAALSGGLVRKASHTVDATIGAGVEPFFNRIQVSLVSRATTFSTLVVTIPPRCSVRLLLAGLTNATATPQPVRGNGIPTTETQVRLGVPVTYQIDDQQQFEFGLLMSARAPHLRSDAFAFNQGETWLYVAYRIGIGTARGGREVGASSRGAVTR